MIKMSGVLNRKFKSNSCSIWYKSCCVPSIGAVLVVIWTTLIHSFAYYALLTDYVHHRHMPLIFIVVSIARAVINILYPLFGLLAESCCLRYNILVAGNFISLIGVGISAPALSMLFGLVTKSIEIILLVIAAIGLIIYQFGQGCLRPMLLNLEWINSCFVPWKTSKSSYIGTSGVYIQYHLHILVFCIFFL